MCRNMAVLPRVFLISLPMERESTEGLAMAHLKEALKAYVAEFGIEGAIARKSIPTKLHRIETS